MPYTSEQCAAFGAKAGRGEKVPSDWKAHCTKAQQAIANKHAKHKHKGLKYKNSHHTDQ